MKYSNRLFGLNLRRLRDAAGKKQKDIAKIFDSDPVTVSRWETGAMGIDKDKIPKLCEFFGVNESEFYRDPIPTHPEQTAPVSKKLGDMTPEEFESWDAKRRQKLSQIEPIPITQKINHGKNAVESLANDDKLREELLLLSLILGKTTRAKRDGILNTAARIAGVDLEELRASVKLG